jgi:hypothetical protein
MTKQTPKNVLAHLKSWKGGGKGGALPKSPTHNNQSEKENPQTSSQGWGELVAKIG